MTQLSDFQLDYEPNSTEIKAFKKFQSGNMNPVKINKDEYIFWTGTRFETICRNYYLDPTWYGEWKTFGSIDTSVFGHKLMDVVNQVRMSEA